jgi:C-terminal processing protease CtpA/Prc
VTKGSAAAVAVTQSEVNMKRMLTASAVAALALAMSVSAFAGGDHCSGGASTTAANTSASCTGMKSAGWAGAWLHRSASGTVTVAEVAKGSPAAKAGLKSGDVVLAVNGYDLSDSEARAECASKASCKVGSTVTYAVQRGGKSTRNVKLKLEKMPANATERYASREASYDPALAAVVMPTATN